jgi:hypothetical protein
VLARGAMLKNGPYRKGYCIAPVNAFHQRIKLYHHLERIHMEAVRRREKIATGSLRRWSMRAVGKKRCWREASDCRSQVESRAWKLRTGRERRHLYGRKMETKIGLGASHAKGFHQITVNSTSCMVKNCVTNAFLPTDYTYLVSCLIPFRAECKTLSGLFAAVQLCGQRKSHQNPAIPDHC